MRFLHIADMHLGKQMNDLSLLPDETLVRSNAVAIEKQIVAPRR